MPIGQRRRLKALATAIHRVAPELDPRIDAFEPTDVLPREGVVLDVWPGTPAIPFGMRLVCWPIGSSWRAVFVNYNPFTLDVMNINDFTDRCESDAAAPRWALGAVWALLNGKIPAGLLTAFEVQSLYDLPPEVQADLGPMKHRADRMRALYQA
jgi:hypothetical protein